MNMLECNLQTTNTIDDCVCPFVRNKMNEEHKEVEGSPHKVSYKIILNDIIKNINKCKLAVFIIISLVIGIISMVSHFISPFCLECIREFYYSVLPNLLGFSITVYAILFGLNDIVRKNLQQEATDKKIPFEVLHATFAFGIIIQAVILILGILSFTLIQFIPKVIVGFISWILLSFIILWTIHTVLYLYSLRTFENNDNKK